MLQYQNFSVYMIFKKSPYLFSVIPAHVVIPAKAGISLNKKSGG